MSRIVVLGSGAWGTAIALALHRRGGHQLTLWSYSAQEAGQIAAAGENSLLFAERTKIRNRQDRRVVTLIPL